MPDRNSPVTSRWMVFIFICLSLSLPANAQTSQTISVAVTLPDFIPLVKNLGGASVDIIEIMPPGSDPHAFTVPEDSIAEIQSCDLLIFGKSDFFDFESELSEAVSGIQTVDWPDYQRLGAILKDFPGADANPHGFWLGYDNARAVAMGIAEGLVGVGVDTSLVHANLARFLQELDALDQNGGQLIVELDRARSVWVAMVPGVAYTIDNLGLTVGDIVTLESSESVSGRQLQDIENKLMLSEYAGLVCPLSMKFSELGEIAKRLAEDTGTSVSFVRFLDAEADDTYLAQAAYNVAAVSAAAAHGDRTNVRSRVSATSHLIYWIIIAGLIILLVMMNSRLHQMGGGLFTKEQKKKKGKK